MITTFNLIPTWISILFLIVIPTPIILVIHLIKNTYPKDRQKKIMQKIALFFIAYFLYVSILSWFGILIKVLFPPIILLLATVPFAFFLFLYILKQPIYTSVLNNLKIQNIVKVHIFRLIGVFFILLAYWETIPLYFGLIAGLGDIITAITSIFVAKAIETKKSYATKLTLAWSIFGTADILFTAIGSLVLTKLSIDTGSQGVETLALFPFCFIPALAPPLILFLHLSIFKKIKQL